MPSIVHFDISAENTERAKACYETRFGWKITDVPGFIAQRTGRNAAMKSATVSGTL